MLRLRQTAAPQVDLLSLAASSPSDVDAIAERVVRHPYARLIAEPGAREDLGGGYRLLFLDSDGRAVEVSADVAARPFQPVGEGDSRPKEISHVVLNSADLDRSRELYESVLDFKVSDWVEDFFCFMRTGPAHHVLAFTRSPHSSLNHVAFEVFGIDEFMRATGTMMRGGFSPIWGPGRHKVGNNTYSYFQDPSSGFVMEYTTALQRVDDDHGWVPRAYSATDRDSDLWGTSNALDDAVITLMRGRPDPGLWTPPPA